MSFVTLRQLRYLVLILTRIDMEALQRYGFGNGINTLRAVFANSEYAYNTLQQKFINQEELNLAIAA